MTTPERLRARQRRETILVVVAILLSCGTTVVSTQRDNDREKCVARAFQDLSQVLSTRGALAERDSQNVNHVLTVAANATESEELRTALDDYKRERAAINQAREDSPIPKFPTGKCE